MRKNFERVEWEPKQGEEVHVHFPDGFVEVCKFIQGNGDGTSDVKVGRKQRYTVANRDIYQNAPAYKKENRDEDYERPGRE